MCKSMHEISPSDFSIMIMITTRRYKPIKEQVLDLVKQVAITSF